MRKKRLVKRLLWLAAAVLILGYGAVWRMAQHPPGPGDRDWLTHIEKAGWSKWLDYQGARIHYLDAGQGPPVLLIHGFADSSYTWRKNIIPLTQAGFRVLAIDLPGMGRSGVPSGFEYSPAEMGRFLTTFLDRLELARVSAAGNSLGGSLTLYLAVNASERVEKMIPVDPACYPSRKYDLYTVINDNAWLQSLLKPLVGPWVLRLGVRQSYHDPDLVTDTLVSQMAQPYADRDYIDRMAKLGGRYLPPAVAELAPHYQEIDLPALIIWGSTDRLIPTKPNAERLHRDIPRSRLEIIPQAGHLPHQEQPEIFNRLLLEFLRK